MFLATQAKLFEELPDRFTEKDALLPVGADTHIDVEQEQSRKLAPRQFARDLTITLAWFATGAELYGIFAVDDIARLIISPLIVGNAILQ